MVAFATQTRSASPDGIRGFYMRVHKMMSLPRRKEEKPRLVISAPFDFQKVNMDLAGVSADELSLMKEQAVASRIGISDPDDEEVEEPARSSGITASKSAPLMSVRPRATL
ncbi:hypothetical protein VD0002_g7912 [Verticillium dahliae]|uniref:Uncharacterized protein n=3 Tax=Verticillium TaxID=1036719 RepID=G2XD22_VERDV|nr:uncharacterized protein VDAG_08054 [Verticillium dahliae VdLs.17]KAF3347898.1 RuvB-like helicase 1 [Verticillium dahliae VDG2]KAH6696242.1 hypothetical protein EV126DRAFT_71509 [Verticillium dahliae]EGY16890.1 hypothetical protein VDAG_08054 [Verticillium dahliae VdLs.17]PNH31159.1 hypothetical protein BJF96_g5386 [Verticillium dahliae]PNH47997.1 hypothetical protein VD0003_g8701 [Verticillium dahliae]